LSKECYVTAVVDLDIITSLEEIEKSLLIQIYGFKGILFSGWSGIVIISSSIYQELLRYAGKWVYWHNVKRLYFGKGMNSRIQLNPFLLLLL